MQRFYLVVLAIVFVSWTSEAMQPQPGCTVTLKPVDPIQKAIEEAAPGAVICLEEGVWYEGFGFFIGKDITIRGAGPNRTIIGSTAIAWTKIPIIVVIQGLSVGGVVIQGPIRATIQDVHVQGAGMYIIENAIVDLVKTTVFGLVLYWQVTVTLTDSQVMRAKLGDIGIMVLRGGAKLNLVNSRILDNDIGISAGAGEESTHIVLEKSVVAGNRRRGLVAGGLVHIEIRESTIEDNGMDPRICGVTVCPGIEVGDQAKVVISNSRIAGNWDWGIAAILRKCGYERDEFTGTVIFEGENVITGNNRSGRFTGEVCLP